MSFIKNSNGILTVKKVCCIYNTVINEGRDLDVKQASFFWEKKNFI